MQDPVLEPGPEPGAAVGLRFLKDLAPNPARGERGGSRGVEGTVGTLPGGLDGPGRGLSYPLPTPPVPKADSH